LKYVVAEENIVIPLGRQGEKDVTTIQFQVPGWEELYGQGSFELLHQRCKDATPYPCVITVSDETVSWVINNSDTQFAGRGSAQLVYVVNNAIAKSIIYYTSVLKSIDGCACAVEPYEPWFDEVIAAGAHAVEASLDSEAWAVGTRDGEAVSEDDETFNNNSKYYSEMAQQSAKDLGYVHFYIDENGDLIMERTSNLDVTFEMIDGDLYLGVA
jgi:hypothetical protein